MPDLEPHSEEELHKVKCQADECGRVVNLYDEPIFVMKVRYRSTKKLYERRWCRHCVVKWSKKLRTSRSGAVIGA